jgi:hypothetical protein
MHIYTTVLKILDIRAPIHIATTQCLQYKHIHSTDFQHIYISMRSNNKVIANQNNTKYSSKV